MADPYSTVSVDFQEQTTKYSVSISNNTTAIIRTRLYSNDEKFQPDSDFTAVMSYNNDGYETNTAPLTITGVVSTTSNYVDFQVSDEFESSEAVGDYYTQVVLYSNSASNQYVFGDGTLHVLRKLDRL